MQQMIGNTQKALYSTETEQSVLGGLLISDGTENAEKCLSWLSRDDFYQKQHQIIFTVMQELKLDNNPIDLVTVAELIESRFSNEESWGFSYLAEIARNTPSAANLLSYARVVKDKANSRRLINNLTEALNETMEQSDKPLDELVDNVYSKIEGVVDQVKYGKRKGLVQLSEVMPSIIDEIDRRVKGEQLGITTGIKSIDEKLAPVGVVNNALFVIGARPKMGKTSTVLKIMEHVALELNKPAAMFTLEMSNTEIGKKLISQNAKISSSVMYDPRGMKDSDWGMVAQAMSQLKSPNLYVSDEPAQSAREIISECRKLKRERGEVGAVFVDYLTLMRADKAERNDLAYGAITKQLKNLAKEINAPVFLLTQLNRNLENRPDKRPKPSDSRDTGQIEQDCDYWVGIYRDEIYKEDSQRKGLIDFCIELNRHGGTGIATAAFINGRVEDLHESFTVPDSEEESGFDKLF